MDVKRTFNAHLDACIDGIGLALVPRHCITFGMRNSRAAAALFKRP
jgi:hypothetical protein